MKTMLVTGASSGIGRALAVRAARAGYAVYAVGRNRDALDALRAKIEAQSGFVAIDATDIALPANARALVARVLARFGSIDVLVNNAGFVSVGPLAAQADDELQRQFGTHVIGPIALVREALDALHRARGQVFMLGSGVARVPVGDLGAYPPAKAAVRSATAILRRELKPRGIAVTYVDPGAVDTPFMRRAGMPGAPAWVLVSPEAVARKILISVAQRPRVVNAVGWQTAVVALAERFPRLTDALLERAPALIGGGPEPALASGGARRRELIGGGLEASGPGPSGSATSGSATSGSETSGSATSGSATSGSGPTPSELPRNAAQPDTSAPPAEPTPLATAPAPTTSASAFDTALEPLRRRMEKLSLRRTFVRDLLVFGATLDLGEIALRWAGMPNKNERAITEEVLEALTGAGFLERMADHAYRVIRTP